MIARRCLLLLALLAGAATAQTDATDVAPPEREVLPAWPRRTSRVHLEVVADPGTLTPPQLDRIRDRLAVALGAACELTAGLVSVPSEGLESDDHDKRVTLTLTRDAMQVQETDLWLRDVGPQATAPLPPPELLTTAAADLAYRASRPRILLQVEGTTIRGQVWGGSLNRSRVQPGDLARPLLRFTTRDGDFRDTRAINWTLLEVTDRADLDIGLDLISGFRSPIPERIRRGETVALVQRPLFEETELLLTTAERPTGGLSLRATTPGEPPADRQPGDPLPVNEHFAGRSDRFGRVTLPAAGLPPWVWVDVQSETVLARVPIAPGVRDFVEVPLTDDAVNIALTERLSAIRADLTDVFASRMVLMSRVRTAIRNQEWAIVDESFEKIDKLPTPESFLGSLNAARVEAVEAAGRDRATAARARQMTERLNRTVRESLSEQKLKDLRDEAAALRNQ